MSDNEEEEFEEEEFEEEEEIEYVTPGINKGHAVPIAPCKLNSVVEDQDHPAHDSERDELIDKLDRFKDVFPIETKAIFTGDITRKNKEELKLMLAKCKKSCTKRSNTMHRQLFKAGLNGVELYAAPLLKMNLKGFSATACQDEDLMRTWDECCLLYDWGFGSMPPETRLAVGLGMLAIRVNHHNKTQERLIERQDYDNDL